MTATTEWISALASAGSLALSLWSINTARAAARDAKKAEADAKKAEADAKKAEADAKKAEAEATKALNAAEEAQAKAQQGTLEVHLRQMLSGRRDHINSVVRDIEAIVRGRKPDSLTDEERTHLAEIKLRHHAAWEDFLNALEQACGEYLDGNVDTVRFKKIYATEVRETVETDQQNHPVYKLLHPEGTSRFRALWKTYRDWYDLENKK